MCYSRKLTANPISKKSKQTEINIWVEVKVRVKVLA